MGDASARPVISEKAHAECVRLLDLLTNKRVQESWSWVFMAPVAGIPGYHDVIKKPMDLGTVKKNLGSKPSRSRFKTHEKFAKDVRLVFQNALVYNKEDEHVKGSVFDAAQHLLRVFENAYTKAKETVFSDEEDAGDHNSSTNEEPDAVPSGASAGGDAPTKEKSRHHSGSTSTISASAAGPSHSHSHSNSEHESSSSSKHKKDKSSKKEKKAKKSKKKSKDKDKDREKDKERSSSSKEKEKDRERKSSAVSEDEPPKKSHASSSRTSSSSHKTGSSSSHGTGHSTSTLAHVEPVATGASTTVGASSKASTAPSSSNKAPFVAGGSSSTVEAKLPARSSSADAKMSEETMNACLGVLMKLIKHKEGNVSPAAPFLQPVDPMHFPDYKIKVPNRMHLYGVQKKLRSGGYATIDTFAYDVRLVFSNCLVYNSDVVLSKVIRSHAVTLIKLFETQFAKIGGSWPGIADRWKCHHIIHEILANRTDGLETAQWFKYPIETYFDSADQVPYGYFKIIKHPMDLGTVSAKLHLGVYRHVPELLQDLKLIFDNCVQYWSKDAHGVAYCESAKKLLDVLKVQSSAVFGSHVVDKVMLKDKSSKSSSSSTASSTAVLPTSTASTGKDRKISSSSTATTAASSGAPLDDERSRKRSSKHISSNFPHKEVCTEIVKALRQHKMKGYQGIEILTAGPFLHAVDVTKYPDYLRIVSEPMDFAKIERKLKGDRYSDVNEFSADVHLIFSNCHKYNSDPVEGADIRAMASNLRDYFDDLYNEKLGNGDKAVRGSSSSGELATLPSAKLESFRTERVSTKAATSSETKKAPIRSTVEHDPAASSADKSKLEDKSKVIGSGLSRPSTSAASAVLPSSSSSSTVSGSKTSTSQVPVQELEEHKKRKKDKKEKKEKKDKKKKDKKEKKKKDKDKERDKKDRKEKEQPSHGRTVVEAHVTPAPSAGTIASAVAPISATAMTSLKPPTTQSPAPVSVPQVRTANVASKISPAESSAAGSKSKTKKSKKSELSGWEASAERVLNRLVKIEQVSKLHFDKPLLDVFPQLEQDYRRLVHEPMDLHTLREKLHDHSLTSPAEFSRLGRVIFQNAIKFNCAPDPASTHVREMSAHLMWYFESLCSEMKLTEASSAISQLEQLRKERAELVKNTPMEVKAKECQKLLRVLNSQKYDKNCWPFRKPVQVLFPTLPPEYYEIIKTPMDLATISDKLAAFEYKVHGEFIHDVRLTFENAIRYNHADKGREGWNVYSAALQMLAVVDEQWCDVTLEVVERVRRREIVRKERDRLGEKRKGEKRSDGDSRKAVLVTHSRPTSTATEDSGALKAKTSVSKSEILDSSAIAKASITIAPSSSKDDPESSTKLRLQIVNRQNVDRMNKSERKAEEKRRKRARREEEIARSEKRRRTAVAATDDALREAELRSRRRIQKLEIAEAVKQREERERQQREDEAAKSLAMKMKFNAESWTGQLSTSGQGFWLRKPQKLQVPRAFQAAIDSH